MGIRDRFEHSVTLLSGMALGAGLMYMFDPARGAARRSYVRGKMAHGARLLKCRLNKQARNLGNHLTGSIAEVRSSIRDRLRFIDDPVLVERVRAQLGHVISHPRLVDVVARKGRITITGDILDRELEKIANCIPRIRGVRGFKLELDSHSQPELERLAGLKSGTLQAV